MGSILIEAKGSGDGMRDFIGHEIQMKRELHNCPKPQKQKEVSSGICILEMS